MLAMARIEFISIEVMLSSCRPVCVNSAVRVNAFNCLKMA